MKTEKGITLLEVLAALTILSFLGIIVWNVLFQVLNFSHTVQTQTLMQQEANTIITALRNIHQTAEEYTIFYGNDPNANFIVIESKNSTFEFNNPNFRYELYLVNDDGNALFNDETLIKPNVNDLPIKVIIYDRNNLKRSYTAQTYISKLKINKRSGNINE